MSKEQLWQGITVGVIIASIIWALLTGMQPKPHTSLMEDAIASGCAGFNYETGVFEFKEYPRDQ
jgi:hypothetical protein